MFLEQCPDPLSDTRTTTSFLRSTSSIVKLPCPFMASIPFLIKFSKVQLYKGRLIGIIFLVLVEVPRSIRSVVNFFSSNTSLLLQLLVQGRDRVILASEPTLEKRSVMTDKRSTSFSISSTEAGAMFCSLSRVIHPIKRAQRGSYLMCCFFCHPRPQSVLL